MQLRACSDPKEPRIPAENICKGLPGLTASLEPGPSGKPIYWTENAFPDPSLTATQGADLAFHGVPAGEHFVTLHGPAGQGVECAPDAGGFAWSTPDRARFRVLSEEGFPTILAGEVNCKVVPP